MRILAANSFHYRRGGDSSHFLDLVAELENRGHEVATFSMQHARNLPSRWEDYWAPNVEYRGKLTVLDRLHASWRSVYSAESARRMARLLADFEPDIVHFHSVHHQLTMSVVQACFSRGVPVVWTLHDYRTVCPAISLLRGSAICERCAGGRFWHGVTGHCKSGELTRSLAAAAESYLTQAKGTLRRVDCYIAPSRFLARKTIEMGLPARRIEVVPNPVQTQAVAAVGDHRRGLLYVGRLSVEKGVGCLIHAVAGLQNAPLRIVGDGPAADNLRTLATRLGADVLFDGWADATSVRLRMAKAELLCVPSIVYENCPGVVLEAMAAGLPVIASDLGGLTELLDDGRAGWLVPAGDPAAWRRAICEALGDEARTARQAARALERVRERHDTQAFIRRIEAIYLSLAS